MHQIWIRQPNTIQQFFVFFQILQIFEIKFSLSLRLLNTMRHLKRQASLHLGIIMSVKHSQC